MRRSGKRDTELLGALLADARTETTDEDIAATTEMFFDAIPGGKLIPIDRMHEWSGQPRKAFDEARLAELALSIAEVGVLEPLVVRRDPDRPGQYLVIAGMRRLLAARRVHGSDALEERSRVAVLPCVIRETAESQAFADALVENLVRQDLTRREVMDAVYTLHNHYQWGAREIARRTGRDHKDISELLRVAADTEVAPLVAEEVISVTAAGPLVEHKNYTLRGPVLDDIRSGRLRTGAEIEGALEQLRRHGAPLMHDPVPTPPAGAADATTETSITGQVGDIPHLTITNPVHERDQMDVPGVQEPASSARPDAPMTTSGTIPIRAHERRVGASTRAEALAHDIMSFVNERPKLDSAALRTLSLAHKALSALIDAGAQQ